MLLRSEQFAAAESRRQPRRVEVQGIVEYSERVVQGETHIRIQLIARAGETTHFNISARLAGSHCFVEVDLKWSAGRIFHGAVARDGTVTTRESHTLGERQRPRQHQVNRGGGNDRTRAPAFW
jgi:hypothetical protein